MRSCGRRRRLWTTVSRARSARPSVRAWTISRRSSLAPGLRVVRRGRGPPPGRAVRRTAGRSSPAPPEVEHTLAALLDRRPIEPGPDGLAVLDTLRRARLPGRRGRPSRARRAACATSRVSLLGDLPGARDLLARAGVRLGRRRTPDADVVLVGGLRRGGPRPARPAGPRAAPAISSYAWSTALRARRPVRRTRASPPACAASTPTAASRTPTTWRSPAATCGRPRGPRDDGVPDVADPVLAALARRLGGRATSSPTSTGRGPSTWSRTVLPRPASRRAGGSRTGPRHPECGCCWSAHRPVRHDGA